MSLVFFCQYKKKNISGHTCLRTHVAVQECVKHASRALARPFGLIAFEGVGITSSIMTLTLIDFTGEVQCTCALPRCRVVLTHTLR